MIQIDCSSLLSYMTALHSLREFYLFLGLSWVNRPPGVFDPPSAIYNQYFFVEMAYITAPHLKIAFICLCES